MATSAFFIGLLGTTLLLLSVAQGARIVELANLEMFEKYVLESNDPWVVEISSAHCGSCQEFEPIWKKLAAETNLNSPLLQFGHVSVDGNDGIQIAQKIGALEEGLPNVKMFAKEIAESSDYDGEFHNIVLGEVKSFNELKKEVEETFFDVKKKRNAEFARRRREKEEL
eukprot:Nk52_evm40s352 gene=Nk52_evmTU40s352